MEKEDARMEDLITSRKWEELTEAEQMFVKDQLGSEEEFIRLQAASEQLSRSLRSNLEPAEPVLSALYATLRQKQHPASRVWEFRVPAYLVVLLMAGSVLLALQFLSPSPVERKAGIPPHQIVIKKDTVYVTKTVVKERLIYRYLSAATSATRLPDVVAKEKDVDSVGVSMSERSLDQLLVSMP